MHKITEDQVTQADAAEVLKKAAELKRGIFPGLSKKKIDANDLQKEWIRRGGDDTRDIAAMLKDYGFGDKEINKVFAQVFGGDEE